MDARPSPSPDESLVRVRKVTPPVHLTSSLSARLLLLTICFVMLCECLVFAPSVAQFRVQYLEQKLSAAHLTLTALEAADMIDPGLQRRLLNQSGMLGMTVTRPDMVARTLGPDMPRLIPVLFDLRNAMWFELIADAFDCMFNTRETVIGVTGISPEDPNVVVEVIIPEMPLREALIDYGRRVLLVSLFVSTATAALVYAVLQWLMVRPMRQLTANMTAFQRAPENPALIVEPGQRRDELGVAERALADMERQVHLSLIQKDRLAGVGAAVTKISHDLKNILATAMLESDRLEQSQDPEVRRITAGLVKAIDRASHLCATTLRFAKEGPPRVQRRPLVLLPFLDDLVSGLGQVVDRSRVVVDVPPGVAVVADPDLLQRAFENLIRNAVEAGASDIRITMEQSPGALSLLVADNGPGLPAKAHDNLFVPFSGSARSGGSGLGLPISREAIRAHGGELFLKSTGQNGTCFVVRLPV